MKITTLREEQIFEWHTISLLEYDQKETEKNYASISYKIWETNNEIASFSTDDLKTAINKYEEMCEEALSEEKKMGE